MEKMVLPYDGEIEVYNYTEGARLIVDRAFKSTALVKGKKKRRRTYYDVIMSFDIETTKLKNLHYDKRKHPQALEFFNITFCWQCSIDGLFIFGRDPGEFFKMLDMAAEELDGTCIIYIHNIAYEFNNLCDFFMKGLQVPAEDIFFKSRSTPLYVRYKNKFEFRCSKQLTGKGLAKIGKEIEYDKLTGDFDYSIQRDIYTKLTPEEINYCYRDVMILDKFLSMERDNFCRINRCKVTHICHLPFTSTGYVRKDVQKTFSYKPAGRYVLKQTALTLQEYLDISPAMWGGYTHTNYRYIAKVLFNMWHSDLISAYPAAFLTPDGFPYKMILSPVNTIECLLYNLGNASRAVVAKITFKKIKMRKGAVPYIPALKSEVKGELVENGKVLYAEELTITACDVDLHLIEQGYEFDYNNCVLHYFYISNKKPLPYSIIMLIERYFSAKTTLKGVEGMEVEYAYAKAKLNSIYGMACQSLLHPKYELRGGSVEEVGTEYEEAKTLPYQWAIYITAYTRRIIYGMICKMQRNNSFVYSDTDSIFFKYDPDAMEEIRKFNQAQREYLDNMKRLHYDIVPVSPAGKPQYMGTLDFEDCDTEHTEIRSFCAIGAKRYYQERAPGVYDVTFSGLRATKSSKGVNGYNTNRLIKEYGSLYDAFLQIRKSHVDLPYVEGVDKLSNYNVRSNFIGELNGRLYKRPCSYTLYPQSMRLSLNHDLRAFLESEVVADYD